MAIKEALKREILQHRTLIYRRNTVAIAGVIVAVAWIPCIEYSKPFGFRVEGVSEATVFALLWGALVYNAVFFLYYIWRDYRPWLGECLERPEESHLRRTCFPEVGMFYWCGPKKRENRHQPSGSWRAEKWTRDISHPILISWVPVIPDEHKKNYEGQKQPDRWTLGRGIVCKFRERYLWFWGVDLGLPVFASIAAVAVSLWWQAPKPKNGCFQSQAARVDLSQIQFASADRLPPYVAFPNSEPRN